MATITAALAIGYNNLANGKTITPTSSQTGYPAANLADARIVSAKHRGNAGALTSFNYDSDLAANQTFECIALLGVNYSDTATRTIKADDTAGFGSPTLDVSSGNVFDTTHAVLMTDTPPHGRHLIHVFNTPSASRYTRVTVTDAANGDNYLQAGVYWVSKLWQPTYSVAFDWKPRRPANGVPGLERLSRGHSFTLKGLTLAQRVQLDSLWGANKRTGRLLIVIRPLTAATWITEAIYCTFAEEPAYTRMMTAEERWAAVCNFDEVVD